MARALAEWPSGEVLRLVRRLATQVRPRRFYRLQQRALARRLDMRLVLENTSNPRNAAAMLRTAEAFGIQHVHIISSLESWAPHSTADMDDTPAAGAARWLTLHHHSSVGECVDALARARGPYYCGDACGVPCRACTGSGQATPAASAGAAATARPAGFELWATDLSPGAVALETATSELREPLPAEVVPRELAVAPVLPATLPRVAVAIGNEHRGISSSLRKAAAQRVFLPQRGFVESLNASVAAALVLHSVLGAVAARSDPFLSPGLPSLPQDITVDPKMQKFMPGVPAPDPAVPAFATSFCGRARARMPTAAPDPADIARRTLWVHEEDSERVELLARWLLLSTPRAALAELRGDFELDELI